MRTDLAAELEQLAHRAEIASGEAYDESDYESGNYHRGQFDAFAYAAAKAREVTERIQAVEALLPRIEGVIEFDMAGERYDAVMSVQQVLEHLRRALDGATDERP